MSPSPGVCHAVPELQDFQVSLKEMREQIDRLILIYGENALIECDGGHNNVSVYIRTGRAFQKEPIEPKCTRRELHDVGAELDGGPVRDDFVPSRGFPR